MPDHEQVPLHKGSVPAASYRPGAAAVEEALHRIPHAAVEKVIQIDGMPEDTKAEDAVHRMAPNELTHAEAAGHGIDCGRFWILLEVRESLVRSCILIVCVVQTVVDGGAMLAWLIWQAGYVRDALHAAVNDIVDSIPEKDTTEVRELAYFDDAWQMLHCHARLGGMNRMCPCSCSEDCLRTL